MQMQLNLVETCTLATTSDEATGETRNETEKKREENQPREN